MFIPKIDRLIGIEVYATNSSGIGGIIRNSINDFLVEETLVDGSKAKIDGSLGHQVLGSSSARDRYLLCVLVKRNWDTFIAIRNIAGQLGITPKQVQIAGIKDAKAVTAQHIVIEGALTEDIQKVNIKDIEVRPIGYVRNKLSSYYLLGNNFHIVISGINHSKPTIENQIARAREDIETIGGFPNFFGHQRFGTTRSITHLVGKSMVKGNFRKAAMLFLAKPSVHEHPESREARRDLQINQNYESALRNFPKQLRYERIMLKHLVERPDDFVGAFRRLPSKLRTLFLQAYQSYLFNKFLSKRIAGGFSVSGPEVGDYVVNVEHSGLPMLMMHKTVGTEALATVSHSMKTGKTRIALPLVGFKQNILQGAMGEIEKQILEEEGVKPEDFKITAMREISERGGLRTVIAPLKNFLLTEISRDTQSIEKHQARISFMLLRGSYATTVLREIMKPRNPIKAGF